MPGLARSTDGWRHSGSRAERLRTELVRTGKTTAAFVIPEEVVSALGSGRRPKVAVVAGTYEFRSSIARMGDRYLLGLSAARREESGISYGDLVDLQIELDLAPREVTMPDDLAAALADNDAARSTWEGLSHTHRRWHVERLESARRPETRARRLAASLESLSRGAPR